MQLSLLVLLASDTFQHQCHHYGNAELPGGGGADYRCSVDAAAVDGGAAAGSVGENSIHHHSATTQWPQTFRR